MGRVRRFWDSNLRMDVILKHSKSSAREFAVLKEFDSPYIVKPLDLRCIDGEQVLVIPFYPQMSAGGLKGYCSERTVLKFLTDVATGLQEIHNKGFVHSDINPQNILIDKDSFIISDFDGSFMVGFPQSDLEEDEMSRFCNAPEWTNDRLKIDTYSDIWSLGASAYMLMMGKAVFGSEKGCRQSVSTEIPGHLSGYSKEISLLIKRCLSFNPEERPTAGQVVEQAQRMLKNMPAVLVRKNHNCSRGEEKKSKNVKEFWPEDMVC